MAKIKPFKGIYYNPEKIYDQPFIFLLGYHPFPEYNNY